MAVSTTLISSRTNARVKQLRAAFSGNPRLSDGLVAIEGDHLLEEALRSGITLKAVFLSERRDVPRILPPTTEVLRLAEDVFSGAVDTRSPQGIAALIDPPLYRIDEMMQRASPLILIAAGLQDPGNLGTLIRSAEAFGATGVLTTSGTVSHWNQKALRASVGSTFRMPVAAATEETISSLQTQGLRLFAAVGAAEPGVLAAQDVDMRQACAILIGNEGAGLAPAWIAMASACVTIPCPGPVESLNAAVAGSLVLYVASRQRAGTQRSNTAITERIPNTQPRRPTGATR